MQRRRQTISKALGTMVQGNVATNSAGRIQYYQGTKEKGMNVKQEEARQKNE